MKKIIVILLAIMIMPMAAWAIEGVAPTAPTGFIATNITQTSLDLSWQENPIEDEVTNYNIYKDGVFLTSKTSTSYTVSNLESDTQYQFYVTAENPYGEGPASTIVTVTTASPFSPPTNLRATNIGATSINITWDGSATSYQIYAGQNASYQSVGVSDTTNYAITDLQPEQIYDIYVTALYDGGESEPSNILSVTLGATPVPASVEGIVGASFPYIKMLVPFLIMSFAIGATFLVIENIPTILGRRRY